MATTSAALATVMGTMAALALQQVKGPLRVAFDGLTYVSIMVPGIVIGISTLIALVNTFALLNGFFASIWPGGGAPQLAMGYGSIIAAHTLFSMALVIVIVRARIAGMDRSLIEASMDLYADPWGTFRQVTLPQLMPAIVAGFLLSLHLQPGRFRHRLLRRRLGDDTADLRLLLDPPRRDAGDQCHRDDGDGVLADGAVHGPDVAEAGAEGEAGGLKATPLFSTFPEAES